MAFRWESGCAAASVDFSERGEACVRQVYTVSQNTVSGEQPRGAAFLDGKAASGIIRADIPFVKTAYGATPEFSNPAEAPASSRGSLY
jgi:hypothetical protein